MKVVFYIERLLGWLSVKHRWFKLRFLDRIKRSIAKNGVSAHELQVGSLAIFTHCQVDHNRATYAPWPGERRINGRLFVGDRKRHELRLLQCRGGCGVCGLGQR